MSRKTFVVVSLVVLASMVLTACQPQTIVQTVEVTKIVAGTPVVEEQNRRRDGHAGAAHGCPANCCAQSC